MIRLPARTVRSLSPLISCVILIASITGASRSVFAADKPNVVVIYADDMGWTGLQHDASLNPEGSPLYETPNLMRLARRGVTFQNAYAASPVCSASRAALLTGQSPGKSRMTDWFEGNATPGTNVRRPENWIKNLPSSKVTLAETLKSADYQNALFGKWHLSSAPFLSSHDPVSMDPLQHGFDENYGGTWIGSIGYLSYYSNNRGAWDLPGLDKPYVRPANTYLPDALRDLTTDFISRKAATDEPFFAMLSEYLVHRPLAAPEALVNKYSAKIDALQAAQVNLHGHTDPQYAAMTEVFDQSVGAILDTLDDPNSDGDTSDSIRDDTIIVFTSDNGGLVNPDVTSNWPLRAGKGSLYEGGIRVPMVVSWTGDSSGLGAGVISDTTVSGQDIYPTIAELAGIEIDPEYAREMDGRSFADVLRGDYAQKRPAFFHYPHLSPAALAAGDFDASKGAGEAGQFVSAMRNGDWKLLWLYDEQRYELYNLALDPGEMDNLINNNSSVAKSLSIQLRQYLEGSDALMPISLVTGRPVGLPPVYSVPEPNMLTMVWICIIGSGMAYRRRKPHRQMIG